MWATCWSLLVVRAVFTDTRHTGIVYTQTLSATHGPKVAHLTHAMVERAGIHSTAAYHDEGCELLAVQQHTRGAWWEWLAALAQTAAWQL